MSLLEVRDTCEMSRHFRPEPVSIGVNVSQQGMDQVPTKSGWMVGSQKIDFAGLKEAPTPPDRVLTCRFHEEMSSPFSPIQSWRDEVWRSKDDAEVEALLKKYGDCPGGIAGLSGQ